MDRKAVIILVISFALLVGSNKLANTLFPPKEVPVATNTVATATNTTSTNAATISSANPSTNATASMATSAPVNAVVHPSEPEKLERIESENVRYTFTSYGGGIKQVELLKYPESVGRASAQSAANAKVATLNANAKVAMMSVLGPEAIQGDSVFTLQRTAKGLRAEKALPNGLVLVKEFEPSTNYLVSVKVRLENHGKQAIRVPAHEVVIGTATPMDSHDNEMRLGMMWYDGERSVDQSAAWFSNKGVGCMRSTPHTEYLAGVSNVVWGAVQNQFFAMAAVPREVASQIVTRRIDLPPPSQEELKTDSKIIAEPHGLQTAFLYPEVEIAPEKSLEREYSLYTGPKEYHTLLKLGQAFNNNLDLVMGYGGPIGFVARMLLLAMNALHSFGLPYAWTIITITVTIKIVFWPLTAATTRSQKRMAALQPQLKVIQERYKDDPQKQQAKIWEFYRENKINPLGGCLPMLVQVPIFFGLFRMLQSAIELRGAKFLWIWDLSKSDTLAHIPGMHLFGTESFFNSMPFIGADFPVNPMPLIMGVTMLVQARLTPPAPGMDPVQQKIMRYMPLMFLVFLYNFSAGLTLYWTVQNLLTILQTKLTKNMPVDAKTVASAPAPKGKK